MKKFNFSLQSLLNYRDFLEKKAKEEVIAVAAQIRFCEAAISELGDKRIRKTHVLDEQTDAGISVEKFRRFNEYLDDLETQILEKEKEKTSLSDLLVEKKEALKRRTIDKKVLEKMKARKKEEYDKELMDLLQKESDDMVTLRKAREIVEI